MPQVCRIHRATDMPDDALLNRYRSLASSLVSDVFDRWAGAPGILPVAGIPDGGVIAAPAFTVRTRPGDNLVIHQALDLARPGEIVVIDGGGQTDRALLGALMVTYAARRDLAGLVVDGAIRDVSDLRSIGLPVFARGVSHLGPYKHGPGELRGAVSLGGVACHDGDIIVGDEDGIAVVPRDRADDVIELAEAKGAAEQAEFDAIANDAWDRSWISAELDLVEVD